MTTAPAPIEQPSSRAIGLTSQSAARDSSPVEHRLIEAVLRRPAPQSDDERRNYYRITDRGLRLARAEARRLEALTRAARVGGLLPKVAK